MVGSRHRIIAAVRGSRFRFEGINGRRIFVARDNSNRTRHRVVASSRSWERKAAEKRAIVLLAAPVNAPTGRSIETAAAPSRSLRPLPLLRGCVGMQVKFTETFARETGFPFLPVIRSTPRGKAPHPFPAANKSKKSPEPISSLAGKFGESEERAIVGRQFLGEERRKEVEEEESRSERHVGENGKIPRRGVGGVFRRLEKRLYDVVPL